MLMSWSDRSGHTGGWMVATTGWQNHLDWYRNEGGLASGVTLQGESQERRAGDTSFPQYSGPWSRL